MGWFRRGHRSTPVREFLVYVYQYRTELASREQYADFKKWVEQAGIHDWVFGGLAVGEDEEGTFWDIAVVDATPDARTFNEFPWRGDFQDIDEDWATEILSQTEGASFISRTDSKPIAAVKRPDGTWVITRSEN
jgi:hypothetical protein